MGVVALLVAGASIWAWTVSAGHIEIAGEGSGDGAAARAPVAIVLGAAVHADGQPSPWLAHRLDAAAELYTSGRVEAILVSGDNRRAGYDEPTVMRSYLGHSESRSGKTLGRFCQTRRLGQPACD